VRAPSIFQKAGLVFISILLSLFIAELVLRLIYPAQITYYVWEPDLRHGCKPDTNYLQGASYNGLFSIDDYGVRSSGKVNWFKPNLNNHYKNYMCIGGSTTECLFLDDAKTWPAQLASAANENAGSKVWAVGNIGKSGCVSLDNYIQLKYCVAQYPAADIVVVMAGLNDLLKTLSRNDFGDNEMQKERLSDEVLRDSVLIRHGRNLGKTWWRRTALFYLAQKYYHANKPKGVEWVIVDDKGESYRQWRSNRQQATGFIDTLPDLSQTLKVFEDNINLMIDEAARQHKQIKFVNQTAIWKDSMPETEEALLWMGGVGKYQVEPRHLYYTPGVLRKGLSLYNQTLQNVCKQRGVQCIDIDSNLPHDKTIFYDDCHFTEKGAALVGRIVYEAIKKN
jgi:lysophospholipase L1-like esterase